VTVTQDQRSTWLQKLDAECPYQIVLPRRQLMDDSAIMDFLLSYVGKFDLYVEDQCPAYVRYCFTDPMDAAIFRSRFEPHVGGTIDLRLKAAKILAFFAPRHPIRRSPNTLT
jgi:hypothetical protein